MSKMDMMHQYLSVIGELDSFEEKKDSFFGFCDVYVQSVRETMSFATWLELPEHSLNNNIVIRMAILPYNR